eukprot:427300-Prymnesium_polylepis.1
MPALCMARFEGASVPRERGQSGGGTGQGCGRMCVPASCICRVAQTQGEKRRLHRDPSRLVLTSRTQRWHRRGCIDCAHTHPARHRAPPSGRQSSNQAQRARRSATRPLRDHVAPRAAI